MDNPTALSHQTQNWTRNLRTPTVLLLFHGHQFSSDFHLSPFSYRSTLQLEVILYASTSVTEPRFIHYQSQILLLWSFIYPGTYGVWFNHRLGNPQEAWVIMFLCSSAFRYNLFHKANHGRISIAAVKLSILRLIGGVPLTQPFEFHFIWLLTVLRSICSSLVASPELLIRI